MKKLKDLEKFLDEHGEEVVKKVIYLLKRGASGRRGLTDRSFFLNSLEHYVKKNYPETISLLIEFPEYGKWIDTGRGPTRSNRRTDFPIKLENWMYRHNIDMKFFYPIYKKIHKEGIKPLPFINKMIEYLESNEFYEELEKKYFLLVSEEVDIMIKNINK